VVVIECFKPSLLITALENCTTLSYITKLGMPKRAIHLAMKVSLQSLVETLPWVKGEGPLDQYEPEIRRRGY
jgi:hypothetical protein